MPGNLSKHSFKNDTDSEISKKGSTMLSGFGDKNKTLNSFYNHKFREEKKLNWIGENFKFGSKN